MKWTWLIALFLILGMVGCANTDGGDGATASSLNASCPVCEGDVDPEVVVVHDQTRVGLCNSPACLDAWSTFSEEEQERRVSRVFDR